MEYRLTGGRPYLSASPYLLPVDEQEYARMDFQRHLLHAIAPRDILAPARGVYNILDVGCGTGRWAIDVAHQNPQVRVTAIDVVSPTPRMGTAGKGSRGSLIPANCAFVEVDALAGLPFATATFDLVHVGHMASAVPITMWPKILDEGARILKQAGYLELIELAWMPFGGGVATETLNRWIFELGMCHDINLRLCAWIGEFLRDISFIHIFTRTLDVPVGRVQGRLGAMAVSNIVAIVQALSPLMFEYDIVDPERLWRTLAMAQHEWEQHPCACPVYVAFGQRP